MHPYTFDLTPLLLFFPALLPLLPTFLSFFSSHAPPHTPLSLPLSLPALPVIHCLAQTIMFNLGETIPVPCQAWGHPKPTISWYLEGEQVGQDGRVQQVNGSLVITNTSLTDEGEFQCFATNRAGVDSVNITLFTTTEREALLLLFFFPLGLFPIDSCFTLTLRTSRASYHCKLD